jgi:hypothetical protein
MERMRRLTDTYSQPKISAEEIRRKLEIEYFKRDELILCNECVTIVVVSKFRR